MHTLASALLRSHLPSVAYANAVERLKEARAGTCPFRIREWEAAVKEVKRLFPSCDRYYMGGPTLKQFLESWEGGA